MIINSKQSGVSLLLAILILNGILALGLGISTLLVSEIRFSRETGYYVPALYAADAGVERALYNIRQRSDTIIPDTTFSIGADYSVIILEGTDPSCPAANYCIISGGEFKNTSRSIEANF